MSKTRHNRAATAATANPISQRETNRLRKAYEEFQDRKAVLTELADVYPDCLAAIEEYAGAYLAEGRKGKARAIACRIANDTACVGTTWHEYAKASVGRLTVEGDLPGDAVPADVVAGLVLLRHRSPTLFSRLLAMDAALGRVLPTTGDAFSASAVMMRAALSAAA